MRIQRTAYGIDTQRVGPSAGAFPRAAAAGRVSHVDKAVKGLLAAANQAREARDNSGWTALGTIFMGPIVGTMIGKAIGGAANDGQQDAARESKKKKTVTGLAAAYMMYAGHAERKHALYPWKTT